MAILVKITDNQGNLLREVEVDAGHSLKINPGEKVVLAGIDPEDVEIETILRHDEFQPVSRAEAHFLAEHLAQAMQFEPSQRKATAARAAFATLRDYMRLRELETAYPDWDQPPR